MITRAVCRTLIGREPELTRLEDSLLAACRGDGGVMILAGDAGIGKSRLASELRRRADKIGAAVLEGSCSEAELALPYLPFIEAIGNYLETVEVAPMAERLGQARRELSHLFPQLGNDAQANGADESPQAKLRLFEAVLAILRIAAADSGLLLIVEDLHWADASTRELLDYITRRLRSSRVLVLATYRKDELHRKHPMLPTVQGWQRSRLAEVIDLPPLPADDVARMVGAIFDTEVGAEFRDFMHDRCEGNPFVLEEMLKVALDQGDIFRENEEWQRKPIEQIRLPETVRDTILLRVQRLDRSLLEILRTASVLGRSFDYSVLSKCCDQEREVVEDALEVLSEQQLVEEEPGSSNRYRFRHALTREAIYDSISAPRRERLHARAADVLRARADIRAVEVAHHLFMSNQADEAVPLCLAAAETAALGYAFKEAADLRLRALPHVIDDLGRARLVGQIGEALGRSGSANSAADYLEEAIQSLDALHQSELAAHFRLELAFTRSNQGRRDLAALELHEVVRILDPLGPSADLGRALVFLAGNATVSNYNQVAAIEFADKALAVADEVDDDVTRAWAYVMKGNALGNQGRVEEALELIDRAYREAAAKGRNEIASIALNNGAEYLMRALLQPDAARERIERMRQIQGEFWSSVLPALEETFLRLMLGDLTGALDLARQAAEISRIAGNPVNERFGNESAADALIEMGRYEEAAPLVSPPSLDSGLQTGFSAAWSWLELHLARGDVRGAARAVESLIPAIGFIRHAEAPIADLVVQTALLDDNVELARRVVAAIEEEPLVAEWPFLLLPRARVARAGGEVERAREIAQRAADTFGGAGYIPYECRARVFLAQCLLDLGERARAEAELRAAWASARSIGSARMETRAADLLRTLGIDVEPTQPASASLAPRELGEKLVTVMFADVRGYSALSEGSSPADLVDRMSALHRSATQEVERRHGVVDKFAGDAVMATFNVSGRETDHAEHAIAAAVALIDKGAVLGLPVGVGIATGPAIVGRLTDGANLSVVGDTTNLASRLQGQARAGEVLLSGETYRRGREWLEKHEITADESDLELKGVSGRVTAYRFAASKS